MIIVDTGPLVAIANDRDRHHPACLKLLEQHPGPVVVPELQLIELYSDDYARAAQLVQQYADLALGAIDACVIAVAERTGATEIATLDRRHFSIVRPKHVSAFTLLPD